jgi:hypothetical protein
VCVCVVLVCEWVCQSRVVARTIVGDVDAHGSCLCVHKDVTLTMIMHLSLTLHVTLGLSASSGECKCQCGCQWTVWHSPVLVLDTRKLVDAAHTI